MRQRQFTQLISDLRAELERSSDPATGVSDLPTLKRVLQRNYETIYQEYDWPHLRQIFDRSPLQAGQRYYDFPDDLELDGIEEVVVWWNSLPQGLTRGIGFEQYADYDSENDDRSDPIQRWDIKYVGPREMLEVWPLPASNLQTIQFRGTLKFTPLIDDDDRCLVDDHLVILASAAELVKGKDAAQQVQTKLAALRNRYDRVKKNSKRATARFRMGLGSVNPPINGRTVVRVSGR